MSRSRRLEKLSVPFLYWILDGPKFPEKFSIMTSLAFQTRVSPKLLTLIVSSTFQSVAFDFWLSIPMQIIDFRPNSGILEDQSNQKGLMFWRASKFQLIFRKLYLLPFSFKVLLDCFLLEVEYSFLNIKKNFFSTPEMESRLPQNARSVISMEISWYPKSAFSKTTELNFSTKVSIDGAFLKLFLDGKISDFPLDWMLV